MFQNIHKPIDFDCYRPYISAETMMGPSSVRILGELLEKHPPRLAPDDLVLDLGCGKGLTSLVLAKETAARIYAADLWIRAEENEQRFIGWGVDRQIVAMGADANHLPFEEKQFAAMVSVDAYHYFGGCKGFFEEKILPFLKDGGVALIGVPGLRDRFEGRAEELLADWLGDDADLFQSPKQWKEQIGHGGRIESVENWEMACFDQAWSDWLAVDSPYAAGDRRYFDSVIRPYTCLVGIQVKIKSANMGE